MNNYIRFVSYMYSYIDEVKTDNVGFAKVELRDGELKLTINMTNIVLHVPLCDIYFLNRDCERVYIGSATVKNAVLYYQDRVHGVYDISEFVGIMILNKEACDIAFATIWVEEEVDIFRKKIQEEYEMCMAIQAEEEELPEEVVEEADECRVCEEADEVEEDAALDELVATDVRQVDYEYVPEDPFVQFADRQYIDAFCDDYYYELVELAPEELKRLSEKLLRLEANKYMKAGYDAYRHILMGRVRNSSNRCFIGVPGTCQMSEQKMAVMYGFDRFKASHRSDIRVQGFGYWYIEAAI